MLAKSHKSFRIDDLLCKRVNSEQKTNSVPASNLTPSASPGSVASSPDTSSLIIDLKSRKNSHHEIHSEHQDYKSLSLPPSPVSSSSGAFGDPRHGVIQSVGINSNSHALNMSKHYHGQHGAGSSLSARRHSHQHHQRANYHGNDFHDTAHRGSHAPNSLERSIIDNRGRNSHSGQTPTQTLTFYSPPSSNESVKPNARDDDALIIEVPTANNQLSSASDFLRLKQSLIGHGANARAGSARSSPSDGRSSNNSFHEAQMERHYEQQRHHRQMVSSNNINNNGNHHQSQQYKMNTILAQQLSAGNPDAGVVYGGHGHSSNANMASAAAAAAAAAASAGLMPGLWPNPFLSLPLIDPATGQPASNAMIARHHHQQQQQQHLPTHQQSIAERAALLFSLNHRFHPYGLPFGNARPAHSLLQVGSKRKGGQIRFSNSQTGQLEKSFIAQKYLNANDRKKLAHSLNLTDRQVKTWFQNRRAKWRKSKECSTFEAESHISGSSYNGRMDDSPDDGTCDSVASMD